MGEDSLVRLRCDRLIDREKAECSLLLVGVGGICVLVLGYFVSVEVYCSDTLIGNLTNLAMNGFLSVISPPVMIPWFYEHTNEISIT